MTHRINVSLPPDWHEAFVAAANGKPLSEWLRDAAAEKLPQAVRKRLSTPRPRGQPRKQD